MSAPARTGTDDPLVAALGEAQRAPEREDLWDKVEELAAAEQRPDEVAKVFRKVLKQSRDVAVVENVGKRAVSFHEEWFGTETDGLAAILDRVLEVAPASDWALRRTSVLYTVGERWGDLLSLYDRVLGAISDLGRRRELLSEAATIAKDFGGDIERSTGYLQQLFHLTPSDVHLAVQLERLLERQGRWDDLVSLWKARLALLPTGDAHELGARLAAVRIDKLGDYVGALDGIKTILVDTQDDTAACDLLETLLRRADAPGPLRRQTLELLRQRYESTGREQKIVPALAVALDFVAADEKPALHREMGERLAAQGDGAAAMEQFVSLMALTPGAVATQDRLRTLAEESKDFGSYLRGLTGAATATTDVARRVDLLLEAAWVQEERLRDTAQATKLFRRAHNEGKGSPALRLMATRRLADLLARSPASEERPGERLGVLEDLAAQLAEASAGVAERALVLGEAAWLADASGETDRAVAAWNHRLAIDPSDRQALDALVDVFGRAGRPDALVAALRRRIAAPVGEAQRRADLVGIALVQATELGQPVDAIDTWLEIQKIFGSDAQTVDALAELLAAAGRWGVLAELLAGAAGRDRVRLSTLFGRMGNATAERLSDPARAVDWYRQALEVDPGHAGARAGLTALLDNPTCRAAAVQALVLAYERTDDWKETLGLVEARLSLLTDGPNAARVLCEAAALYESKADDLSAALEATARALSLVPQDSAVERSLVRLAEKTGAWARAVEALRAAIGALPGKATAWHARLHFMVGSLLESRCDDRAGALEAYQAAFAVEPGRMELREVVIRGAARLGRWDMATATALGAPVSRAQIETKCVPLLEGLAKETKGWEALSAAMSVAVTAAAGGRVASIEPSLARDLEARVAAWYEAQGESGAGGKARDLAEAALLRASNYLTGGTGGTGGTATELAILRRLAEFQRRAPGRALFDTLLLLSERTPGDLDAHREAAGLAVGALAAEVPVAAVLSGLLDRAAHLLRAGQAATGTVSAADAAAWAVAELARLVPARAGRAHWSSVMQLLVDSARLPLPRATVRTLRRQAAEIAAAKLRDRQAAIPLYRQIVDDDVDDRESAERLAALYQDEKRLPELLVLRQDELARATTVERRLALRLDIEHISGVLEDRGGRIEALRANLDEQPGHEPSVVALAAVLEGKFKHAELGNILEDQGKRLEEQGDKATAARMWTRLAALAEGPLGDLDRATFCYERVANLEASAAAFESLGRLYLQRGEPLVACGWFERWLASTEGTARIDVAKRLARAYVDAGRPHRAVACLERLLGEHPSAVEVRATLVDMHRTSQSWDRLAHLLIEGCVEASLPEAIVAAAQEVWDICRTRLSAPERALPALEKAAVAAPGDQKLRAALAEALLAAGDLPRARQTLQALIDGSGRRRSRERAGIHHQMARVARAQGDAKLALEQLEQASAMDVDNGAVQLMLAEIAEENRDLDRAERAYRALILLAKRESGEPAASASEVLLRLRKMAADRGQADKAGDLLDSAINGAMHDPAEAQRLGRALRLRGELELEARVAEKRLAVATEPAAQAVVLTQMGEIAEARDLKDEALTAFLQAIDKAPTDPTAHAAARRLAHQQGAAERYLAAVLAQVETKRRWGDATVMCQLLLMAGAVAEEDLQDPLRAVELYGRVLQVGGDAQEPSVRAAAALARVAGAQKNEAEREGAIKLLIRLGTEAASPADQIEACFRLAEVQLGAADTREQGLLSLSQALQRSPDLERAFAILRQAGVPDADLPKVLPLYEQVARASSDDRLQLDFLVRRAELPNATPQQVREAVDLASALNETARTEAILVRAVDMARQRPDGLRQVDWALIELAQIRRAAGDLDGAVQCLEEARAVVEPARLLRIYQTLGRDAERTKNHEVAARILQRLWEANPGDRRTWEPLLSLYARSGDREGFERVASQTVARMLDTQSRNAVRILRARFLLREDALDRAAIDVLREVLHDDPSHAEAMGMLADLYDQLGDDQALSDLLAKETEAARERDDTASLVALSLRRGSRLARTQPQEAKEVFRGALKLAPGSVELGRALLALLGPQEARERAELLERLLAEESGDEAATLALELAAGWTEMGDDGRVGRVLELGRARAPQNRPLFERLCDWHRAHEDWGALVNLLASEADRHKTPAEAVPLLSEAAEVQLGNLGNPTGAAALLGKARRLAPGDVALLRRHIVCLMALGDRTTAAEEISTALGAPGITTDTRVDLLRSRAELHEATGQLEAAIEDLEQIHGLGVSDVEAQLVGAITRFRAQAARAQDQVAERRAVLRLVDLLSQEKDDDPGRALLADWVWRHPDDHAAMRLLRSRDEAGGRWEAVADTCAKLLQNETGAEQIAAAEALVTACERIGRPEQAIAGLEDVFRQQPDSTAILDRLVRLYEVSGEHRKLATLLLESSEKVEDTGARVALLRRASDLLIRQGEVSAAVSTIQQILQLHPGDREATLLLVDASLAAGDHDQAEEILKALVKQSGKDNSPVERSRLQHRMARLAAGRGDKRGQLDWLKRALDTNRKDGEIAAELADLAEELGEADLAIKALRAVTLLPAPSGPMTSAVAYFRQARIALKTGDRSRAIIFARRALQEEPQMGPAVELLNEIGDKRV